MGLRDQVRRIVFGRPDGVRARLRRLVRPPAPSPADRPSPDLAPRREEPDADGWTDALAVDELAPGGIVEVVLAGRAIAVANVDGDFFAVTASCPHAGGPLADGYLDGCTLTCPLHGWTFDLASGACLVDPAHPLERWDVRVRDGRVFVRVA